MQNVGRYPPGEYCENYLAGSTGCGPAQGSLELERTPATRWILEPAGGAANRFYLRMAVSACRDCLGARADSQQQMRPTAALQAAWRLAACWW